MRSVTPPGKPASISPADLRNILRWVFLLRISLCAAILLSGAFFWGEVFRGRTSVLLLAALGLSFVVSLLGWWRLRSGRTESAAYLWLQLFHDLFLITVVVLYTEGVGSAFTLLYIPLVALASVLFGASGGGAIATAASTIFVLLGVAQREFASAPGWAGGFLPQLLPPAEPFLLNVLLLVTLFFLVALLTAFLRRRLVSAGARVRELENEIQIMTIDTRDVLDSIESGVVSIDGAGRLAYINREALELLGIRLLTPDPAAVWLEVKARAPALARLLLETLDFRPAVSRGEVELPSAAGAVPLGITTNLLYDETGRRRGVTAVFRDISHVKRMEELSRQRDRAAAVAELAASLAHEIKNPLASIRSSVELLAGDAPRRGEEGRLFGLIVKESDRLAKLLTDFLNFSRMELREERPVALRELLEEVVELHALHAGRRPEVRVEWIGLREPVVSGDFDLLKQLFQNLLANAVQSVAARPGAHRVTISVTRDYGDRAELYDLDPAAYIETRVADDGGGIDPDDLPRIFDPFFTTKPQGNGLGLAIVHRIVNVHGGAIFVESTPGEGAEFRVYLPLAGTPSSRRARADARLAAASPSA